MKNERGHALFLALLAIVFVSVVGIGLLTVSANSNKITVYERQNQALYYIAEAGINHSKSNIIHLIDEKINQTASYMNTLPASNRTQENFRTQFLTSLESDFCTTTPTKVCEKFKETHTHFSLIDRKQPQAVVTSKLSCDSNTAICTIVLTSEGRYVSESTKRLVEQKLEIDLNRLANLSMTGSSGQTPGQTTPTLLDVFRNFAAVASGTITVKDDGEIKGNIGTFGGDTQIFVEKVTAYKNNDLIKKDLQMYKGIDLNIFLPPFPTYPSNPIDYKTLDATVKYVPSTSGLGNGTSTTISDGSSIKNFKLLDLSKGAFYKISKLEVKDKLEIKLGNTDAYLEVDDLIVKDEIKITGTGKLHLIVKNSLDLQEAINPENRSNVLAIYYLGTNDLVKVEKSSSPDYSINDSRAYIGGDLYTYGKNVQFNSASGIGGRLISDSGKVEINTIMDIQSILKRAGELLITSGADFDTVAMTTGDLTVKSSSKFNHIYLNEVNAQFDYPTAPKVEKIFYMNNGIVNLVNDVKFLGNYVQLEGTLTSAKQSDFNTVYLGNVNTSALASIDVSGNLYARAANLNFTSLSDLRGDVYLLSGKLDSNNFADFYGNVYYAGKESFTLNKFVDAKKNKLIVAPNADVNILGSADVKGTVIAENILIDNRGYIKYEKPANIDDYYSNTPIPSDNVAQFVPINDYMSESSLVEK